MNLRALLVFVFLVSFFKNNAQESNQFRIFYGFSDSALLRNNDLVCGVSFSNHNSREYGFKYLRSLSDKLSVETGVNVFNSEIKQSAGLTATSVSLRQEKLSLTSIPLYVSYSLGSYFFINGGPTFDFQNRAESFDSQSGIGYGFGIGANYRFNAFFIYLNPYFKQHSFIPFEKENYPQKLKRIGVQIGIGYSF